ncbi:MAG: dihydropteroate synthase [Deltaproteobacteria bacterium]|nr:dihydropteroate synthase [Deltaproteobacteria bacterium]
MAVLNATPDSFSDGGCLLGPDGMPDPAAAVRLAGQLVADGAHVLDVGGESTRPGAREVPEDEEIARTVPVLEALAKATAVPLSIDTRKARVAEAALAAGARVVNDVSGLRFDPDLARVVARGGATLVLGHLRGVPETMQDEIAFDDCLAEVGAELAESAERACRAGVARDRLVVDPGIGFGKRTAENLALLAGAGRLRERLGLPLLVGPSRKAFLGEITGDPVGERGRATIAACAVAVFAGADALRVHDVAGAARAAAVGLALRRARPGGTP